MCELLELAEEDLIAFTLPATFRLPDRSRIGESSPTPSPASQPKPRRARHRRCGRSPTSCATATASTCATSTPPRPANNDSSRSMPHSPIRSCATTTGGYAATAPSSRAFTPLPAPSSKRSSRSGCEIDELRRLIAQELADRERQPSPDQALDQQRCELQDAQLRAGPLEPAGASDRYDSREQRERPRPTTRGAQRPGQHRGRRRAGRHRPSTASGAGGRRRAIATRGGGLEIAARRPGRRSANLLLARVRHLSDLNEGAFLNQIPGRYVLRSLGVSWRVTLISAIRLIA